MSIILKNITFGYDQIMVMDHLDLEIQQDKIIVVVGPSGCGKSTFLRLIGRLENPRSGEIVYQTHNNDLRFLFQDYDAFPWYSAWENVRKAAPSGNYPSKEDVRTILERVGLWESRKKYPAELSGGMRKRLALARCLVHKPALLLLDEPFAKLDVDTRYEMYELIQELWQEYQQTIILVTHDLHEAIFLGSKILVSTAIPFHVRIQIDVPFDYPRTDAITTTNEYLEITKRLRTNLRLTVEKKTPNQ